jgi:hypothetical protein
MNAVRISRCSGAARTEEAAKAAMEPDTNARLSG